MEIQSPANPSHGNGWELKRSECVLLTGKSGALGILLKAYGWDSLGRQWFPGADMGAGVHVGSIFPDSPFAGSVQSSTLSLVFPVFLNIWL